MGEFQKFPMFRFFTPLLNVFVYGQSRKHLLAQFALSSHIFYQQSDGIIRLYKQGDMDSTAPLDKGFLEFCDCLASKHIAFHFLDETLLEKYGSVDSKSIVCGAGRYDYLIIPPQAITLSESTAKLLREFVSEGGKLFVAGEIPTYLEGEKFNFDYLFSNVGLNEILIDQPYRLTSDKGVHSVYRKGKNCDFIFAVNITDRPIECEIAVPNKIVRYYDLNKRCVTGLPVQTFVIKENSSVIFCTEQVGAKYYDAFLNAIERNDDKPKNYIRFDFSRMRVVSRSENILPLDFASYSFDGINYSERLSVRGIFQKFLEDRVDGEVYLKFVFESKIIPANISLLLEKDEYNAVTINGKEIDFGQFRNENYDMRRLNLQSCCVAGRNEIVLKTRFFQSEYVYYVLFDEKVTEGMKNSLVYDTYFDTIYLKGDFGVFGDTEQGKNDGVILAKNLYIDRVKEEIGSLLFDGFMFFAGKMILEKEIYLDCAETILIFSKRIHYAKIWLNDKNVGELLFDNVIDVSSAAKRGKNKIKLELYTAARNLYGPHHDAENEESFMVSPDNFMKSGWKDGKSKLFREEYALLKTEFEGE